MSGDGDLVTVCIATKDRADRLPQAIESVLSQTYQNIELFVVDDGSTDATPDVVRRYAAADSRVRSVRHDSNKGLACARNEAIQNGTGVFFTFIDDDDLWDPEFVSACVDHAASYPEVSCFCTGYSTAGVIGGEQSYIPEFHAPLRTVIEAGFTPPVAAQFYLRSAVVEIGGYDERIRSGVDHDLWLRLAGSGAIIASIPRILAFPDTNLRDATRMTTDFAARRAKIAHSLVVWKDTIRSSFSPGFYEHFVKSYEYAICRKEVAAFLKSHRFTSALKLAARAPFRAQLFRFVLSKLRRRSNLDAPAVLPPSFPPFRKGSV